MEDCKDYKISKNYTPLCVRNELNNRALREIHYSERIKNRKKRRKKEVGKGKLHINSKLMKNMKKTKCFIEEMMNLSYNECGIIARLRTEHIDLNLYNSVIFASGEQTDPKCDGSCCFYETVRHYLIDCNQWHVEREDMFWELKQIDVRFEKEKNRNNIMRVLFPHLYQKKPHKLENIMIRVKILKSVCKFVSRTQRFKSVCFPLSLISCFWSVILLFLTLFDSFLFAFCFF